MSKKPVTSSRVPASLLVASATLLGAVYAFQYIGGLVPCKLCLYQRVPHAVVIAVTILSLLTIAFRGERSLFARHLIQFAGLALLAGAGIAAYHVGIEYHWWAGPDTCSGTIGQNAGSIENLLSQLEKAPIVRCDEVAWSLLGISMAGYNFLISAVLGLIALIPGLWPLLPGVRR